MQVSTGKKMPKPIAPNDPRLQHLRSNPAFRFENHTWDYTDHVLDALAPRPGMAIIYNFDGELDDKLRLENLLLHWSSTAELVIIAGQRLGGDDTYEEMKGIINEVLGCKMLPNGHFSTSHNIRLLAGAPLSTLTNRKADAGKIKTIEEVAAHVARIIGTRPFVFHNNTSFSLLDKLLGLPVHRQLRGCSFTCATPAFKGAIRTGANARWDLPAFNRVIDFAKTASVPFLSVHGSLAGWKKQDLPELKNWAATMLAPAATEANANYAREMVRFGMGLALRWAIAGYACAKRLSGQETETLVQEKLASVNFQVRPVQSKGSDGWASLISDRALAWSTLEPSKESFRFRAMAGNAGVPLSNTLGDLGGSPLDIPCPKRKKMIILRTQTFTDKGFSPNNAHLGFAATVGTPTYSVKGGLYLLAYAKESETVDAAWASIRLARTARHGATPNLRNRQVAIIDRRLAEEFLQYRTVFEFFLRGALDNIGIFPPNSKACFDLALDNLKGGEMTRLCKEIRKTGSRISSSG